MISVAVLIPVLGRPERAKPLVDSLFASNVSADHVHALFLVSPDDQAQLDAVIHARDTSGQEDTGAVDSYVVPWQAGPGDYARKINAGAAVAMAGGLFDWLFLAADDLHFHPGWLDAAVACHIKTHACVVGTNDLGNTAVMHREHSTHTLVSIDYLECGTIDEPDSGKLLHEGYDHNFVDNEFIGTAIHRQTYAQALDARVEHLHPNWRKAENDPTYVKGQARFAEDQALFNRRRELWGAT